MDTVSPSSTKLLFKPLSLDLLPKVIKLSDQEFGSGYYTEGSLRMWIQLGGEKCSLALVDAQQNLYGFRITFLAGSWLHFMKDKCKTELWNISPEGVAYFKSILITRKLQGQGWGSRLSQKSIEVLKKMGNTAIVCHSWRESFNNSSTRYLEKLGFKPLAEHKNFWSGINYHCSRCGTPPCQCTALEMILYLRSGSDFYSP